jgi:hypothetical protein
MTTPTHEQQQQQQPNVVFAAADATASPAAAAVIPQRIKLQVSHHIWNVCVRWSTARARIVGLEVAVLCEESCGALWLAQCTVHTVAVVTGG